MKLRLIGHSYKYAVEQIMLMLFPDERPEYVPSDAPVQAPGASEIAADVRLTRGTAFDVASTRLYLGGTVYHGTARAKRMTEGKLETDSLLQKLIKLSFYRAAVKATGKTPVWGALTGIRPGKLATNMLEKGFSEEKARRALTRDYFLSPERAELCVSTAKAGLNVIGTLHKRDVALYIGIPFCPTRCYYCSFVSHSVEKSMKLIEPFLDALRREIDTVAETVRRLDLSVIAVYIGGGTPTTLSADQLDTLMRHLQTSFDLSAVREYSVEAGRPDTVTRDKLLALKANGAGRVSINPQTMSDSVLAAIGRRHTVRDVVDAMRLAREVGFETINMDLIAGLPDDSAAGFMHSLDEVLSLEPENVTVHTLSLKKGTRLTLDQTPLPDAGAVGQMLDYAAVRLRERGYTPYYLYRQKFMSGGFENVGWSLNGHESLYNILIMEELATILALGGGGVTKLVDMSSGRIERIFNPKYPYEYVSGIDAVLGKKSGIDDFYA